MKAVRMAIGLVLTLLVGSASAQPIKPEAPTGTRITKRPDDFPIDTSREILRQFAECSAKKYPQLTHEMLMDISKVRVNDRYLKAADPDCLLKATAYQYGTVALQMSPERFRYAVADALVKRNLNSFDPAQIASAPRLPIPTIDPADYVPKPRARKSGFMLKQYEEAKQRDLGAIALSSFGECVVRANTNGSRDLLKTKINSDEELQSLRAMMPSFSACLDRGQQFKTERATLRGAVALNYYRLAYAPRQHSNIDKQK